MATIQDLIVALETKASRATFVALETLTDARARKTGNPHPKILKRSRIQVVIGHRYENSVNNQRAREGKEADFEASPRQWGTRVTGTPFVEHNGKLYLECGLLRSMEHGYETPEGSPIAKEEVLPFLPEKRSNAPHQGVEKEIILRDYALESIKAITIDGEKLEIE